LLPNLSKSTQHRAESIYREGEEGKGEGTSKKRGRKEANFYVTRKHPLSWARERCPFKGGERGRGEKKRQIGKRKRGGDTRHKNCRHNSQFVRMEEKRRERGG